MATKANVIVYVRNNDLEFALKVFNEKCRKELIFKKIREHEYFSTDSEKREQKSIDAKKKGKKQR